MESLLLVIAAAAGLVEGVFGFGGSLLFIAATLPILGWSGSVLFDAILASFSLFSVAILRRDDFRWEPIRRALPLAIPFALLGGLLFPRVPGPWRSAPFAGLGALRLLGWSRLPGAALVPLAGLGVGLANCGDPFVSLHFARDPRRNGGVGTMAAFAATLLALKALLCVFALKTPAPPLHTLLPAALATLGGTVIGALFGRRLDEPARSAAGRAYLLVATLLIVASAIFLA